MGERADADKLANRLLDEPNADQDDDLRVLSRQLLRRGEVIERLEKRLTELTDGTLELIHANRDSILRIHEKGLRRIKKVVSGYTHPTAEVIDKVLEIIHAVNTFHPMHGESWRGWPEETEEKK